MRPRSPCLAPPDPRSETRRARRHNPLGNVQSLLPRPTRGRRRSDRPLSPVACADATHSHRRRGRFRPWPHHPRTRSRRVAPRRPGAMPGGPDALCVLEIVATGPPRRSTVPPQILPTEIVHFVETATGHARAQAHSRKMHTRQGSDGGSLMEEAPEPTHPIKHSR